MKKIQIAIIGCGRISLNHIKAIDLDRDRAHICALCDVDKEKIEDAQKLISSEILKENKPEIFLNFSDLIDQIRKGSLLVNLLVICTPSGMHPKQVIKAAELGVNICTEKPMATKWQDGINMINACENHNSKLFVVKQNRLNKTLQLVKKQLENGRFGKLSLVTCNVFWQRPQNYYDKDDWRGTWDLDGGALMNQASHYLDILHWLIGPVESIQANSATLGRNIEVEDTATLLIKWRNAALGTMAVTMLTYPENLEGSITILGSKGSVKIGGKAVNEIELWKFADDDPDDESIKKASDETTSAYGFGHYAYYQNLFDHIQNDTAPVCDGREGLKSLELLIASYRSARDKKPVYLPLHI